MDAPYTIHAEQNLVEIVVAGAPDAEHAVQVVEAIKGDARLRPGFSVLTDRTHMTEAPSAEYVARIVEAIVSLTTCNMRRWATVAAPGSAFGVARMTELRAGLRGVDIASFTSRDEAMRWLLEGSA